MPSLNIHTTRSVEYHLKLASADPQELVILLHGYQQRGETVLGFTEPCFGEHQVVVAPDAPFPIPYRARERFRLGYAWYFFDVQLGEYRIDMSHAVDYLVAFVASLAWADLPKRIVGYSQGGYLAPFLGLKLEQVHQVVGVNSRFRSETLGLLPFPVDGVHGQKDTLVDPENSQRCHRELTDLGNDGIFHTVPESGHQIDRHLCDGLRHVLQRRKG